MVSVSLDVNCSQILSEWLAIPKQELGNLHTQNKALINHTVSNKAGYPVPRCQRIDQLVILAV